MLAADHARISSLLDRMVGTTPRALRKRGQLLAQLAHELSAHAEVEDAVLYGVIGDDNGTCGLVAAARQAHARIATRIEGLRAIAPGDPAWRNALGLLKREVELHIREEEGELFERAALLLSREEAEALGDRIEVAKNGLAVSIGRRR